MVYRGDWRIVRETVRVKSLLVIVSGLSLLAADSVALLAQQDQMTEGCPSPKCYPAGTPLKSATFKIYNWPPLTRRSGCNNVALGKIAGWNFYVAQGTHAVVGIWLTPAFLGGKFSPVVKAGRTRAVTRMRPWPPELG
jgi:hypothetical protein